MKKLLLVLIMACISPAIANMKETQGGANAGDPDFAAGKAAIKHKDWKTAIEALNKSVKRAPDNPDTHTYLGYSYRNLGDLDNSFAHYREALKLDPKHKGAHEYIGQAYLKAGQPDKAAGHLAELEKICGKGCEEYQDLANAIARYHKSK
ncbi:MAG: tetratricopeptide repeat protein [Oxalobacteraceae bacterium]